MSPLDSVRSSQPTNDAVNSAVGTVWDTVDTIDEAVERLHMARDNAHFWELVVAQWRVVVPSERTAVLLHVDRETYDVVQRTEDDRLRGAYPDPVDFEETVLERPFASACPEVLLARDMPKLPGFVTWLRGAGTHGLVCLPLTVADERIGCLVSAVDQPPTCLRAAGHYARQVAMTWRHRRLVEHRLRAQQLAKVDAELHTARDRAVSASRAKSTFLSNMSHELRTPLNAIIGYAELLAEDPELEQNSDNAEDITRIRHSAAHLLRLISDVLDLSKIEAGKMRLDLQPVAVRDLLGGLLPAVEALRVRNRNRLTCHVDDAVDRVRADAARLRQILLNLMSNACKFTTDGLIEVNARPWPIEGRPGVLFQVRDTGVGMTPAQLRQCFEPFEQPNPMMVDGKSGTGLGLAVGRHLTRLMEATLELVSEPGKGTEAQLWVPAH